MPKCPACRYSWREMEDESPTECPSCGWTGVCEGCGGYVSARALREDDYECGICVGREQQREIDEMENVL
jgi:hypothetical protein